MQVPAKLRQKRKRSGRWRSTAHCDHVREHACSVPGCKGKPIEVAHLRLGTDAAMGRKASDFYTISLCRAHHRTGPNNQHTLGELSFAKRHGLELHGLAAWFCSTSPKVREIAAAKRERGL